MPDRNDPFLTASSRERPEVPGKAALKDVAAFSAETAAGSNSAALLRQASANWIASVSDQGGVPEQQLD
jgi:hypothetical protein